MDVHDSRQGRTDNRPAAPAATPLGGLGQRPARTYTTGPVIRAVRAGTLVLTAVVVLGAVILHGTLPESIPTHFDIAGQPDAWGPKWSALVLAAVFAALIGGLAWLSHHPRIFNYPVPVGRDNAQRLYRAGEMLMIWVNASCAIIFVGVMASTLLGVGIGPFLVVGLACMGASIIGGLVLTFRAQHGPGA